ncbi:hypothetical protein FE374_09100 [Georgenia yuyongxinii]|uniref:Uncharacterized protein n=1 Tax=Georgenia yuyongxinii TaxID=2589797 RepID=A0A5B8C3V1_9MICO|nr:hypothetical protein [Georgenia yuyongxinii]QDC24750.1 hypothetical protein FE374_09100 [Georgenia yuyongxinii]
MTATGDFLNQVVPTLVRLARRPGALLLTAAGVGVGLFAALGLVAGLTGEGWAAWVPLGLAVVLAVPVLVLAVRRERLQARTQDLHVHRTVDQTGVGVVVVTSEPTDRLREEVDTLNAAVAEGAMRTARFLPRVEAAQRAALLAAGGPVRAPYLADDLRVTVVALLGTLAAVPLSTIGWIATAAVLLSR